MKKWYNSKTIQLAVLMGISGVLTAVLSEFPELKAAGIIMIGKSLIDIYLRVLTSKEIY